MPQYFVYNRYDASSLDLLSTFASDIVPVDFYSDYDKYAGLILPEPMPCIVDKLEYAPENVYENTLERKQEKNELDRDEMLIDLLIQQQEILLELQIQAAK